MSVRLPLPMQLLLSAVLLSAVVLCGCRKPPAETPEEREPQHAPAKKPAFVPLDLQPQANQKLNVPPQPRGQGNNLGDLPRGKQTLAGVPFVVGASYVQLGSLRLASRALLVSGIAVNRKVQRLHFLHAASFSDIHRKNGGQQDGAVIGSYVVHYQDGSSVDVPIVYGRDVRDWWNWDDSKPVTGGRVAWTGTNTYAARFNIAVRLYVSSWSNPHPEKNVATIDVRSANSISAPICVAITAEGT
jgi:hypothetical protein